MGNIDQRLLQMISENSGEINSLVQECAPYLDAQFQAELLSQPYSRIFELIVCKNLIMNLKSPYIFQGQNTFTSNNMPAPDFLIKNKSTNQSIWIECIAVTMGSNLPVVSDLEINKMSETDKNIIENYTKTRFTHAIKEKSKAIANYREKGIIKENDLMILAICSGELNFPCASLVEALLGRVAISIDPNNDRDSKVIYIPHDVKKPNGTLIKIGDRETNQFATNFNAIVNLTVTPFLGVSNHSFEYMHSEVLTHEFLRSLFSWVPDFK